MVGARWCGEEDVGKRLECEANRRPEATVREMIRVSIVVASFVPFVVLFGLDSPAASLPVDLSGSLYWGLHTEVGEPVGSFSFAPTGALRIETDCGTIDATPGSTTFGVRRVDASSGRPIQGDAPPAASCSDGGEDACWTSGEPLAGDTALLDAICAATTGLFSSALGADVQDRCLLDIFNSTIPLDTLSPFSISAAIALSEMLTGNQTGRLVARAIAGGTSLPPGSMVELNKDPEDGMGGGFFSQQGLGAYLTDQQEALLGCGPFYGTNCDVDGIDLSRAEAGVLLQSFPHFEVGNPVATRFVNGQSVTLPGARGPSSSLYDPLVDGCTSITDGPLCASSNGGVGARTLVYPKTDQRLSNELGAASFNFMVLLASLGAGGGNDPGCNIEDPFTCQIVRGVYELALRIPADDPVGPPQTRWIWERSTDYEVVSATGELGPFGQGSLRVIGPEVSRVVGTEMGFAFAALGSGSVEPPSCLPLPHVGEAPLLSDPLLLFYGPVPEPAAGAAAGAALAALAMVASRKLRTRM